MYKYLLLLILVILSGCMSSSGEDTESAENEKTQAQTEENTEIQPVTKKSTEYTEPIIKDEREAITPSILSIPAINVEADIEHVGVDEQGRMGVPDGMENVAWFEPGTKPGAAGNSVIAGHVDDTVNPAVFYDLHKLEAGDEIHVQDKEGKTLTFEVIGKEVYNRKNSPVKDIFGYSHRSALNLITCEGDFNESINGREDRLVVYTELKK
ncbi:class F sortase [Salimicrobium halophilum]|uniref:LPXTG-site transpeptidase (Sortase) family protein n=1 Tax=Salimicrobium halophilum TaxID=86666 RepID=A0A1G8RHP6_9BACI|nr:class F sortase [Salimicrobium halophilum]SDJ16462.1 LPXTG-site transpeptidase (sortase) family protein [Salimicrobium halophilum]